MNKTLILGCIILLLASSILFTAISFPTSAQSACTIGTLWEKYEGNPLATEPAFYGNPYVLFNGSMYQMWYLQEDMTIGYATSVDGITWHDFVTALPKGTRGQPDEWESSMVGNPWVLYDGTQYQMWYHGYVDYPGGDGFSQIGYAWSEDGITWEKHGSPVLARGSGEWDDYGVFDPTVILEDSIYKMWYIGRDGRTSPYYIGYATSEDGKVWDRYDTWVMEAGGGGWDDWSISGGMSVVKTGDTYFMWYSGRSETNWQIGLAYSDNGTKWYKCPNPVVEMDPSSWDSIYVTEPTVIQMDNTYTMWYLGLGSNGIGLGLAYSYFDAEAPTINNVIADPNPASTHDAVTLMATVDDALTGDSIITFADYSLDGGTSWMAMSAVDGAFDEATEAVTASLGLFEPGIYDVIVRGTDAAGNTGHSDGILLAIYDPDGGFVTGGGWFTSPAGAYTPDATLTGKAVFGFVSKYQKGANVPTGQTEFQFRVADLNFHSTSYHWLVVAGSKAQFKGEGTLNGDGEYGFMLTANDGQNTGDVDRYRIKIWDKATDEVTYDNQLGDEANADATTEIQGGNIIIHKAKE
jgi:predicted GH43/DUF377 family glycosyl hydrolase